MTLEEQIHLIRPADADAGRRARARWDSIAKPLNGLGALEAAVTRIAALTGDIDYEIDKRCALVMCADNGVVVEGVTQTDSEVTAIVARNLCDGKASMNHMSRVARVDVFPVDIGINHPVDHPGMICRAAGRGTGNIFRGPAMSRAQAEAAIETGMELALQMRDRGYKILLTGEMGIGNTTTSSAVAAVLLNVEPERVTGRGAGLTTAGLWRKVEVVREAIRLNAPDPNDPVDVLCKLGGFDIAGLVGVFLGGALYRVPVVLDGFISSVAALVAARLCPDAVHCMLASHVSAEPAGRMVLNALGLAPVITADLCLGEGTGAAALMPLMDMGYAVYRGMPTFEDIRIEAYQPLK